MQEARGGRRLVEKLEQCVALEDSNRVLRGLRHPVRFGRMRLYRHTHLVRPARVRATLFTGQEMTVVLPEPASRAIYLYGCYEPRLTRVVLEHVHPGMVFADVGAHFGYHSVIAHHVVGQGGRVFAFEPTPTTFEVLRKNTNGLARVTAENVALFSSEGVATLHDFGLFRSEVNSLLPRPRLGANELAEVQSGVQKYQVRTVTMDSYFESKDVAPDFVKIDAESAELEVLRGMGRLLKDKGPMLSIETGDFGVPGASTTQACAEFLAGFGYCAYESTSTGLVPHTPREQYELGNLIFVRP